MILHTIVSILFEGGYLFVFLSLIIQRVKSTDRYILTSKDDSNSLNLNACV
jgi:hypothetical protein